jgi:hypothetical protein
MVDYTILNGYVKNGKTLGKENLGLEEVKGVVVANEYANLYGLNVLAQGKTQIKVAGEEKARTMDITTKITDIGESRVVYTQNTAKVIDIADSGKNTVKQYGEGVNIGSAVKFQAVAEMSQDSSTEYFQNFSTTGYYTSDVRIEYVIHFVNPYRGHATAADYEADAEYNFNRSITGQVVEWSNDGKTLRRVIPAGQTITLTDYDNMWLIFTRSNGQIGQPDNTTNAGVYDGKVFVMTQTAEDISDKISFVKFEADYLNPIAYDAGWTSSANGQWVKFIDNDGDGVCDYAFLTRYYLDEVISTYTNKAGDTVMQYNGFNDDDTQYEGKYTTRYMQDDEAIERDVAVGDIVLWAPIDNQVLVSKAESVTTSATSYNYKTDEIIAADGNTYGQSGIYNATDMQDQLSLMAPKTEYEMFLDKFGFVRAYRQPGGTKYALVTELYYTNNANGNLVQNWPMTVELTMPDENGKAVTKEYSLANPSGNAFVGLNAWTYISNVAMSSPLNNWLQPAIAHLGIPSTAVTGTNVPYETRIAPTLTGAANGTYWPLNMQLTRGITLGSRVNADGTVTTSGEFNYGEQLYRSTSNTNTWNVVANPTVSFTNVAVVGIDGDKATLNTAAKLSRDKTSGLADGYAVDYIQLKNDVRPAKGAASFPVVSSASGTYGQYVNADKDTEIYIVYNGGVQYYKGYTNMPALTEKTVGKIHAAYTVARNTTTGTGSRNYWMADVVVYEVEKWNDLSTSSISLAYYTAIQQMQSANGVTINTLNSKTDPAKVDLIPSGLAWGTGNNWWDSWGYNASTGYGWQGYGFYQLYNATDAVDGTMSARAIKAISKNFNDSGIYAGIVTNEIETAPAGYIPVNMDRSNTTVVGGKTILATDTRVSIADGKVYSVTDQFRSNETTYRTYTEANTLQYNNVRWSEVKAGDLIIWVGGADTTNTTVSASSFIVDLGNPDKNETNPLLNNYALWEQTPSWLGGGHNNGGTAIKSNLWGAIMGEQEADAPAADTITIKFKYEANAAGDKIAFTTADLPATQSLTVGKGTAVTLDKTTKAYFEIPGWEVSDMTAVYSDNSAIAGSPTYADPNLAFTAAQTIKDITVTVKYAPVTASLTLTVTDTAASGLTAADISVAVNGVAKGNAGTMPTLSYGDTVTLSWTGADHVTYTVSGAATSSSTFTNGAVTAPYAITGKVTGAAAITLTTGNETATTVTGATGNGVSAWAPTTPAAGSIYAGMTFTIGAPTVTAGYEVESVYWTDDAGTTKHPMTEIKSGGVVTGYASADKVGTKPVTVYAVTRSTVVSVTIGNVAGTVAATADYTDGTGAVVSSAAFNNAGNLTVKKGTLMTITFTTPTAAWVQPQVNGKALTGLAIDGQGTNTVRIDLTGVNADTLTLGVFDTKADLDSWVDANS